MHVRKDFRILEPKTSKQNRRENKQTKHKRVREKEGAELVRYKIIKHLHWRQSLNIRGPRRSLERSENLK